MSGFFISDLIFRVVGGRTLSLVPVEQSTVDFFMRDLVPGKTYTVSMDGQSETFNVKARGGLRAREEKDKGTDPMVYVAAVLGIAVIAFMAALIANEARNKR